MSTSENFIAHLIELRKRLLRSIVAFGLVFAGLVPFAGKLYSLLARPLLASLPAGGQMIATGIPSPFMGPIKATMMVAFMIALPYVLYQIWRFVAPGLYAHEKRLVLPLIMLSTLLFYCGMAFAYFIVFPTVFHVIVLAAPQGVAVTPDIEKYLSFALTMFLAFGITFEVPIIVVVLVRVGVVSQAALKNARRYVLVGAFVVGAIFTPPDVMSQLSLAIPLYVLYEAGIVMAGWVKPKPADQSAAGEA